MRLAALAFAVVAALSGSPAFAACSFAELPAKSVQVDAGVTNDGLTNNRGQWNEQYVDIVSRDGTQFSVYGRAADDQRFGVSDPSYETGVYDEILKHVIADASVNFSPTHNILPSAEVSGGADFRMGDGYGFQAHQSQRSYPTQIASITTLGLDRYSGVGHIDFVVSLASLTNVPGIAMSETLNLARYFPCDNESVTLSAGRDVESTGVGTNLAVYKSLGYDVNDVHWFNDRFAINIGAGWYLLVGAYDRYEVRIALRERL